MVSLSPTVRRIIWLVIFGACGGVVMTLLNPVNATLYRIGFLVSVMTIWLGLFVVLWSRKGIRALLLILLAVVTIPFFLPNQQMDTGELRTEYLARLKSKKGTTYHWGGESARGIDCSGLPRRSFRDALLIQGLTHANGKAFRKYAEQWWYDTSAESLGLGYRGFTIDLYKSGKISTMSYDGLEPGDLAVTVSGVHVLVYLGGDLWIQADPGIGSVATLDGRKDKNPWFNQPITMHRWQDLAKD